MKITPVLIAGGYGTRLWPLSRRSYPKQFSDLLGKYSLFQQSALRLTSSKKVNFDKHIIITNADFRFIVSQQLQSVKITSGPILLEPFQKNTGPAILAVAIYALKKDPNSILLIAPSDHTIRNEDIFHEAIVKGIEAVLDNKLVTFGIKPTRAETGYGYLELEEEPFSNPLNLKKFIEKPDKKIAEKFFKMKNFLWNSGIFLFKASDILDAYKTHANYLIKPVIAAIDKGITDLNFFRLEKESWNLCKDISIDYAVMEKCNNCSVVPLHSGWSDLGEWEAVGKEMKRNRNGVKVSNNAYALDCKNTVLRSENENQQLVGLGLKDIIAVSMPDAVLVTNKNKTQNVKNVVEKLKANNISQAEIYPRDHRPWGWFETLIRKKNFLVKSITVNPNSSLSLQKHHHRSEHWVVVEGKVKVTLEEEVKILEKGQSIYIPLGAIHRMENPGKKSTTIIEIQTGSYLSENDIVRIDDVYSRK